MAKNRQDGASSGLFRLGMTRCEEARLVEVCQGKVEVQGEKFSCLVFCLTADEVGLGLFRRDVMRSDMAGLGLVRRVKASQGKGNVLW